MSPKENDIMRSVEDHYWWYKALRGHVASTIEPLTPAFSLLDAGCGTGGMLNVVRQKFPGANLTGVDQSAHALGLTAARETGARLVVSNVEDLPFQGETFDFVLSLDVFSATGVDTAMALSETHRVLRPNGRLILNVAALDALKGNHDRAIGADRRYSRQQLRKILEDAHFRVERLNYWNTILTPPIAVLRWLGRVRSEANEPPRSDFRPIPPLLNSALRCVATLELKAGHHISWPFGTSLLAVARKNG